MVQRNPEYLRVRPQDGVYCPVRVVVDDADFFTLEGDLNFYTQGDDRGVDAARQEWLKAEEKLKAVGGDMHKVRAMLQQRVDSTSVKRAT